MESWTEFGKTAKVGDQIIIKLKDKNKANPVVYMPLTILEKQIINDYVFFYHDDRNSEETKISWSKFQRIVKKVIPEKLINTRTINISEEDVNKILREWK